VHSGLVAEFESPGALAAAARRLRGAGYRALDSYGPFPAKEVEAALEHPRPRLPVLALAAGIVGGLSGYLVQWYCNAHDYPIDVGGRPAHAAPAFVPITFEMTILFAALATVLGLILGCGLPRLWHPLFEVEGFGRAAVDRFFLAVSRGDERFDAARTAGELTAAGALRVAPFGEERAP